MDAPRRLEHALGYVVVQDDRIELWTRALRGAKPDVLRRTVPRSQITSVKEGRRGALAAQRTIEIGLSSGDGVQLHLLAHADSAEWIDALTASVRRSQNGGASAVLEDLLSWLDRNPSASVEAVRAWCEARKGADFDGRS